MPAYEIRDALLVGRGPSGADAPGPAGKKSGGSKVLQAGLLNVRDLWLAFATTNAALLVLAYFAMLAPF